jgi:hypothetical protein
MHAKASGPRHVTEVHSMSDLTFLALGAVFFVAGWAFVRACARL